MRRWAIFILVVGATLSLPGAGRAETLAREQDIANLRLGQRVLVDDGSCPAGEIKEVTGVSLTPAGVARGRKCVPRPGSRR
jgi:hypothetical protein